MGACTSTFSNDLASFEAACGDLYIYGLPVLEMARARQRTIGSAANQWRHVRRLADASSRRVTTPNNDTLYSSAWLDLRKGPVELTYPKASERYLSIAILDMYTNNFVVLGPRQTLGDSGRVRLVAPKERASGDEIVAPTHWVWAQVRTLVSGPEDIGVAHQLQDGLRIVGAQSPPPGPVPATTDAFEELQAIVGLLATEAPPLAGEHQLRERWEQAGLTPLGLAEVAHSRRSAIDRGLQDARNRIAKRLALSGARSGWIYPEVSLGDFGADYIYRASIATWGLGALPLKEAVYLRAIARDGQTTFPADTSFVLRFPPGGLPPARAFWSLSLYEALGDGRLFFAQNPLGRYAVGDRTPGLRTEADGSLTIWIGARDPGESRRSNWLPASGARFALVLRAYNPDPSLLNGRYLLPRVEEVP
ncbi:MAG: DUF1254 domain-containing protein [Aquidulcibacter sp.]|uniref:DUF1254 domain-containing protein n=2 Tax=Aquidulcibacter sp. TaxID=2052990 RepID=UPI0022C6D67D|nr:DUF1254 domain-containing protein [Aquidulcibacter sp.]